MNSCLEVVQNQLGIKIIVTLVQPFSEGRLFANVMLKALIL